MDRYNDVGSFINENKRHSRSREDVSRRRRQWMIEQDKQREHERRKQRMIQEYEERRAREISQKTHSGRSPHRSVNDSNRRSQSPSGSVPLERSFKNDQHKRDSSAVTAENMKLFKGPEGTKIPMSELKNIKTIINRPMKTTETATPKLDREIENPEEIKLIRREGEGAKPIFERDELKHGEPSTSQGEERRVVTIEPSRSSQSSRRRSPSGSRRYSRSSKSPTGYRYRSREGSEKVDHYESSRYDRERHRDRSRDYPEAHSSREYSQNHSYDNRRRTSSRERDDSRYRSRDHERERHDRHDRHDSRSRRDSRERDHRMTVPHHYMEPVAVPVFCENFMPPIMVNPMMLRNPVPIMRGRMPPIMGPVRTPFMPRPGHQPPMFRAARPPNPRGYGRMT